MASQQRRFHSGADEKGERISSLSFFCNYNCNGLLDTETTETTETTEQAEEGSFVATLVSATQHSEFGVNDGTAGPRKCGQTMPAGMHVTLEKPQIMNAADREELSLKTSADPVVSVVSAVSVSNCSSSINEKI